MFKTVLKIYLATSGQWSGKIICDGVEHCSIAGCDCPEDVEQAAYDQGFNLDHIETV